MRAYKTEGIIIKRRNFGEVDRVLTILTPTYGKIQVRAPGVRRITSRRSSHIELLNLTLFGLYKSSRSFMPIVTEALMQEEFFLIKKRLEKVGFAYYICELIDSLCAQNQENRRVFFLARDTLFKLSETRHSGDSERSVEDSRISKFHRDYERVGDSGLARMTGEEASSIIATFEDELLVSLGFLPKRHSLIDKRAFIESILEKKLRTRRLLPLFLNNSKS